MSARYVPKFALNQYGVRVPAREYIVCDALVIGVRREMSVH